MIAWRVVYNSFGMFCLARPPFHIAIPLQFLYFHLLSLLLLSFISQEFIVYQLKKMDRNERETPEMSSEYTKVIFVASAH